MTRRSFTSVQGRRIEYRWFEPPVAAPGRPAIVMLHEGLGSVAMWKDFPQRLATAAGCRVMAYSRFGYGGSDPPAQRYAALQMHRREALEVLPEVLGQLGIASPVLFGHSDGASIAMIYAGARPRQVAGLIVMAPHAFVEDMCIASIQRIRQTYLTTDMRRRLKRYHDQPDCAFWLWNDLWLDPAFRSWNIESDLQSIACPVLAIQGDDDEYGTIEQLRRIARAVPQARILTLDRCRHSPQRDRPEAVLAAAQSFPARSDDAACSEGQT